MRGKEEDGERTSANNMSLFAIARNHDAFSTRNSVNRQNQSMRNK